MLNGTPEDLQDFLIQYDPKTRDFTHVIKGTIPAGELLSYLVILQSLVMDNIKLQMHQSAKREKAVGIQIATSMPQN